MDEKDKEIVRLLRKDGRMSYSKIGEEVDMSHVSVRKRLKNLQDEILEINPALDFEELGYRLTFIFVEAKNDKVREDIIEVYQDCPRTIFLSKITGEYNLLAVMFAENQDVQESELGQCAVRTQPGIRRSEVVVGESPIIPKNIQYTPPDTSEEKAPCGPDCSECERYKEGKCLGCPATVHYRG